MPDHLCIVSNHAKLKFSFDRHNVSPSADSYNWPCISELCYCIHANAAVHKMCFMKLATQQSIEKRIVQLLYIHVHTVCSVVHMYVPSQL